MLIRKAHPNDREEWARMRNLLWPGSPDEHLKDIDEYFLKSAKHLAEVFVLEKTDGKLGGFIELNFRNTAEGSEAIQVPYVEGWFVDVALRKKSYGTQLMEAAEKWAMRNGFFELASDTELENSQSIAIHKKLNFIETDRVVCFIKKLR